MMLGITDADLTDQRGPDDGFGYLPEILLPVDPDRLFAVLWRSIVFFDVGEAVCLWAGVDPGKPQLERTDDERSIVAAASALIKSAIHSQKVELDRATVSRQHLQRLAVS